MLGGSGRRKGEAMATAARIVGYDLRAGWVGIEDDAGKLWTYHKRRDAPSTATPDIRDDPMIGRLVLVNENDGKARLRQGGHGLPRKAIVHLAETGAGGAPLGVVGGWAGGGGTYEYEP
jgi:hypothetical protein